MSSLFRNLAYLSIAGVFLSACNKSVERGYELPNNGTGKNSTLLPNVKILAPVAGTVITTLNQVGMTISGNCSEEGRDVSLSVGTIQFGAVVCQNKTFSAVVDWTPVPDGNWTLKASHKNVELDEATDEVSGSKHTGLPNLSILVPAANSSINAASPDNSTVSGLCSENGRIVHLTVDGTALFSDPICAAGTYSTTMPLKALSASTLTIRGTHSDNFGNTAKASVTINKKTSLPIVTIANPVANSWINAMSPAQSAINGSCSENGRDVVVTAGGLSSTVVCSGGSYSTTLALKSLSDGTITIQAKHTDFVGNSATASVNVNKKTSLPMVTIQKPADNFVINASNQTVFNVNGLCSENGRNVDIAVIGSVTLTGSVVCNSGAYSKDFNASSLNSGPVQVTATHKDIAENVATASRSGTKAKPVCNPFGGEDPLPTNNGLAGYLSYLMPAELPSDQSKILLSSYWKEDPLNIANSGALTPKLHDGMVDIFVSQLNTPNQRFEKGFSPTDGSGAITYPNSTSTVMEWFSVNFRSRIKLKDSDPTGTYQIAVIADDAAVVKIKVNGVWKRINTLDGLHSETMACPTAADSISLDRNSDIPLQVVYMQGPRIHISLQLIWRKVSGTQSNPVDPLCGNSFFHDENFTPSKPLPNWDALVSRGWKPLEPLNFWLPDDVINRCI